MILNVKNVHLKIGMKGLCCFKTRILNGTPAPLPGAGLAPLALEGSQR